MLFLGACDDPPSRKRGGSGDGGEQLSNLCFFCKHSQRKNGTKCAFYQDAWILANMINKAVHQGGLSICRVTDIYSTTRKSFVNWVVSLSREQGLRYELVGAELEDIQEGATVSRERLTELGRIIERDWEWTWKTSPCDDLQKALSMLDQYDIDNGNERKATNVCLNDVE